MPKKINFLCLLFDKQKSRFWKNILSQSLGQNIFGDKVAGYFEMSKSIYQTAGATSQETVRCAVISLKPLNFTSTKRLSFFFCLVYYDKVQKFSRASHLELWTNLSNVDCHPFLDLQYRDIILFHHSHHSSLTTVSMTAGGAAVTETLI